MKSIGLWAGLLAATMAGCASDHAPTRPVVYDDLGIEEPESARLDRLAAESQPSVGDWTVSIVGTPFLMVFRSVVCVSSVVIAAPFSAVMALTDEPEGLEILGDGVTTNCAGPYVLRPSDVS